jgi:hypothetical protein
MPQGGSKFFSSFFGQFHFGLPLIVTSAPQNEEPIDDEKQDYHTPGPRIDASQVHTTP